MVIVASNAVSLLATAVVLNWMHCGVMSVFVHVRDLSVCWSVCLSVCSYVCLSVCLFVCMPN